MKDRLIELLTTCGKCDKYGGNGCVGCEYEYADDACEKHLTDIMANDLLTNGVIVPPVKMGQIVWWAEYYARYPQQVEVTRIQFDEDGLTIGGYTRNQTYRMFDQTAIGDYVFLTKDDAEEALKERQNNEKL